VTTDELSRIKQAYARRDFSGKDKLYTFFNPSALFISQGRERAIINVLKQSGIVDLSNKRILDLGCGSGGVLRDFIKYGAQPENIYGLDLLPDRIEKARKLSPNVNFTCGNAEYLPYEDCFFDMVLCFTVFSSILCKKMKENVAKEMLRVLKAEGFVFWYDYHMDNPKNPDVRGVKKQEIFALFPNCSIQLKRVTLAPPLARLLAPYSWLVCHFLEKIPALCTHYLGVIRNQLG